MLLLLVLSSLFGTSYLTLMPIFARDVLHGSSELLGYMMSAVGGGALAGAIVTSRISPAYMRAVPCLAAALFGGALAAFAMSETIWLSLLLLVPAGFGMMAMGVATNTLIQGAVEDVMRGRVMAYYVMSFIGMVPISSLLAGWISHEVGAPLTLAVGGTLCVVAAIMMAVLQVRASRSLRGPGRRGG